MCFGRKDEIEDALAPRPTQQQHRPSSIDKGSTKKGNPSDSRQGEASSSKKQAYAPPPQPQYVAPYVDVTESAEQHQPQHAQPDYHQPPPPPPSQKAPAYTDAPPTYDGGSNASQNQDQHNWQAAVPDTSLFPPPPAIFSGFYRSPTSNATEEEAEAGEAWCAQYPMTPPLVLDDASKGALHFHNIRLMEPVGFNGKLTWLEQGCWAGETAPGSPDRCILSYPPLYAANLHGPPPPGGTAGAASRPHTAYYEVRLLPDSPTTFLGLGFTALPYPSFRMPGWHRGSLAVHGDDGHKYINDRWGGKDFTAPFQKGETYGIGLTVKPAIGMEGGRPLVDIFFTRNGQLVGGWNIHEETDAEEDLPVTGLEGFHDLCAAIGTYDSVRFEAVFEPSRWLYKDVQL